jgi:hypothetical protein
MRRPCRGRRLLHSADDPLFGCFELVVRKRAYVMKLGQALQLTHWIFVRFSVLLRATLVRHAEASKHRRETRLDELNSATGPRRD